MLILTLIVCIDAKARIHPPIDLFLGSQDVLFLGIHLETPRTNLTIRNRVIPLIGVILQMYMRLWI
jgi:hypothetical protein